MQQDIVVRAGLIFVFAIVNMIAGRRVRVLQFVVVSAGIVLFNLVIPTGKVLAAPLGLPITEGALKSGLMKATAMTGLIVLSQFSIRPNLRLPGRIGGLIGRSLYYFEAIMSERRRIDRKDIIGSVDALLLSVRDARPADEANGAPHGLTNIRGGVAMLLIVASNWIIFALTLLYPRPFWGG
jgi:heptaprenyl diphosphate synthase